VTIELIPLGSETRLDLLNDLASALPPTFGFSCRVSARRLEIDFAHDARRNQYHSTAILKRIAEDGATGEARVLGVTAADLFVPVLTFVFGEAQIEGCCAVVSYRRLHEEFYGLPPNPELLRERLRKEAVHELGHTFGLRHCLDWRCVMSSSHGVERLDVKTAEFCPACRKWVFEGGFRKKGMG
jgi:archaemetzincin